MEHDIPRFELKWHDLERQMNLVWLDHVPDNLSLLLKGILECWIGEPMNRDTRRRLDADIRRTLCWMVAKGDLVWYEPDNRWELEV